MASEKLKTFLTRSASALILAPLVVFLLYAGAPYNQGFLAILALLCAWEWRGLCFASPTAMNHVTRVAICLLGLAYIFVSFWTLALLGGTSSFALMGIFLMVWTSDIGAYLVGNVVKGPRLWPKVSPNKTWSGFVGGFLLTLCAGYLLIARAGWALNEKPFSLQASMIHVSFIALVSPLGDLLESWIKRRFQIKDSGHLIPGHGGVLDRMDALIAVGVALFFYKIIF